MTTEWNAPTWFDISTPDAGRAREFYRSVFGWTAQAATADYALLLNGPDREAIGGMGRAGSGSPYTGIVLYLRVEDVDAALERAVASGGRAVLSPVAVPGRGRIAVFADPDGNPVGVVSD